MGAGSSWAEVATDANFDLSLALSDAMDYFYARELLPGRDRFSRLPGAAEELAHHAEARLVGERLEQGGAGEGRTRFDCHEGILI
jgi:hypothetical protein